MPFLPRQIWVGETQIDLGSTGDQATFRNGPNAIMPLRWGWICSVAWDVAAFVCKLDHVPFLKDGATTNRTDGSGGFNMALTDDMVVGACAYVSVGGDKDSSSIDATGGFVVKPGDSLIYQVTSAMTTGDGFPFLDYQILGFDSEGLQSEFDDEDGSAASLEKLFDGSVAI